MFKLMSWSIGVVIFNSNSFSCFVTLWHILWCIYFILYCNVNHFQWSPDFKFVSRDRFICKRLRYYPEIMCKHLRTTRLELLSLKVGTAISTIWGWKVYFTIPFFFFTLKQAFFKKTHWCSSILVSCTTLSLIMWILMSYPPSNKHFIVLFTLTVKNLWYSAHGLRIDMCCFSCHHFKTERKYFIFIFSKSKANDQFYMLFMITCDSGRWYKYLSLRQSCIVLFVNIGLFQL